MECIKYMFRKKNNRAEKAGDRAKNSVAGADNQAGDEKEGDNVPSSLQAA
jgi:hypothetical protein